MPRPNCTDRESDPSRARTAGPAEFASNRVGGLASRRSVSLSAPPPRRCGGGCGDAAAPRRRRHHADRPARRPLWPGRRAARSSRARRGWSRLDARAPAHSISAETTLGQDVADAEGLAHALWPLCERLSACLKQASLATGRLTSVLPNARHKAPQRISRRARHHGKPPQMMTGRSARPGRSRSSTVASKASQSTWAIDTLSSVAW